MGESLRGEVKGSSSMVMVNEDKGMLNPPALNAVVYLGYPLHILYSWVKLGVRTCNQGKPASFFFGQGEREGERVQPRKIHCTYPTPLAYVPDGASPWPTVSFVVVRQVRLSSFSYLVACFDSGERTMQLIKLVDFIKATIGLVRVTSNRHSHDT